MYSLVLMCVAMSGTVLGAAPSHSLIVSGGITGHGSVSGPRLVSRREHAGGSAETASCRKFVGAFYTWYLAHSKSGDPLRAAIQRYRSNFSPELILRLNEDRAAAAKSPGEIVGLDFDPVLNGQDLPDSVVLGSVTQNGRRFHAEIFDVYSGKKSAAPAVIPELAHEHGRWVFTNFLYRADGKSDDLLSILAKLKADRKKGK